MVLKLIQALVLWAVCMLHDHLASPACSMLLHGCHAAQPASVVCEVCMGSGKFLFESAVYVQARHQQQAQ